MVRIVAVAFALALAPVAAFAGNNNGNQVALGLAGGLGVAGGYGNNSLNTFTKTQVATGHGVIAGGNVKQTFKFQSVTTETVGSTAPFSPTLVSTTTSN